MVMLLYFDILSHSLTSIIRVEVVLCVAVLHHPKTVYRCSAHYISAIIYIKIIPCITVFQYSETVDRRFFQSLPTIVNAEIILCITATEVAEAACTGSTQQPSVVKYLATAFHIRAVPAFISVPVFATLIIIMSPVMLCHDRHREQCAHHHNHK